MFSYRSLLSQAFKIAWKNKFLWFFGIFASLLSIGAEYQILMRAMSRDQLVQWLYNTNAFFKGEYFGDFFSSYLELFKTNPGSMIVTSLVLLIILGVITFLIYLAIVSQIAIVNNSEKIIKAKKEEGELTLREGLKKGNKNFWSVLWLNLVTKVAVNILVLIVSLPLLAAASSKTMVDVFYIILFIVFIPMAIAFSLFMKYAISFVVIKGKNFFDALRDSWGLFRKNWIVSVEMAFVLFFVSFISTIVIILATFILAIPFIILATSFLQLFSFAAFWVVAVIGVIVLIIFIILAGSLLSVFQITAWTDLFLKLIGKGASSKIERLAGDLAIKQE